MSQEQVLDFIRRVSEDPNLQSKLETADGGLERLIQLAAEAGFAFTADEFRVANLERWKAKRDSDELAENELSVVVGGLDLVKFLPDPVLDGSLAANTGSNSQSGPSIDIETKKLERMIQKP